MKKAKELFQKAWEGRKVVKDYWQRSATNKIILINVGVYSMWKFKLIPEDFLVKHFATERYNVQHGRFHTLITHAFSHMGIFSMGFDLLMLGFMGRAIQASYGKKYIYLLFGLGSLFGGLTGVTFQRPSPYIQPQIGPESAIAAYLTFMGLLNPHQTFLLFFFPMKVWILLALLGTYSLFFDPQKRYFAGMTAGLTVFQMMRGRFI